jgi:hypothetical protein
VLSALQSRGLAERVDGHWAISAAGHVLREAVEEETDRAAAPPFGALKEADRAAFLQGLATLPD